MCIRDSSYIYRITALYSLQALFSCSSADFIVERLLPIFLKNAKDPIPNVKFVVSKILQQLNTGLPEKAAQQIKQALIEMQKEDDKDVSYFSSVALNTPQ
eukprot:TRINITY_DN1881_c0_g1_i2.p3 TRINITY_DN1881_c0_g1~~TRINITY_DN1881_c0_g1_i2.p3  ORF type:complete len:100 (-),score=31.54 TRINITY_DN1881_c0_g1_i2:9-308(-)